MKQFVEKWNGVDNLDLFIDVYLMREAEEKYSLLDSTKMMVDKMYEEIPETETTPRGTRRPTTRAERRASTRKAKKHLKEIEPLTMSVRQTRNGGYIRKGDTYSWLPEWKKADHRASRHTGKELCRNYEIPEREISPLGDDIDPEGTWDVESQCFFYDLRKRAIHYRLVDVEGMTFPSILTVSIIHNSEETTLAEFVSLGLIESVEEGKRVVEKFITEIKCKGDSFPYIAVNSVPIKGESCIGTVEGRW